jgi:hypothetical protein
MEKSYAKQRQSKDEKIHENNLIRSGPKVYAAVLRAARGERDQRYRLVSGSCS